MVGCQNKEHQINEETCSEHTKDLYKQLKDQLKQLSQVKNSTTNLVEKQEEETIEQLAQTYVNELRTKLKKKKIKKEP